MIKKSGEFNNKGFTLIEVLIAGAIFSIVSYGIYFGYSNTFEAINKNESRFDAIAVLENEMEIVRNLNFDDVGIDGGYPPGKLSAEKTSSSTNGVYLIKTTVRSVDDSYDGTLGGSPNDTAPADYKIVESEISCVVCKFNFKPFFMTATVAPKGLEGASKNGALFINVFDASGQPVVGADVKVVNNVLNPTISISDTTNNDGVLQLVDIPTSTSAYEITVSKSGYSMEKTYPFGGLGSSTPVKVHSTVAEQQITSISFSIDKTGSLNFSAADSMCQPVANVDFSIFGTKLIGSNPDIVKYSTSTATGANGTKNFNNLEWDTYNLTNLDSAYEPIGIISTSSAVVVNPGATSSIKWIVQPIDFPTLLIDVKNQDGQAVQDASVNLTKAGYDKTMFTGRYSFSQTNWSGGDFSSQSGEIETESPAGEIALKQTAGVYPTSTQWLISDTFNLGSAGATFYNFDWQPTSQPLETGSDSLKFQIASNNDNSTWNFVGPDGTDSTFYATSSGQINSIHNNSRYLRYKAYFKTENENFTPVLNEIKINFNSPCAPAGQTFFNNLAGGDYNLTIQKSGYQISTSTISILNNWQEYNVQLSP